MNRIRGQKSFTVLLALLLVLPLIPLALWSFANKWQFPKPLPQIFGSNGWVNFLTNGGITAIGQSIFIGLLVTALIVPLSFSAARIITKSRWWFVKIFEAILFLPVFLPPFVLVMGVTTGSVVAGVPPLIAVVGTLGVLAMPYSTFVFRSAFINYGSGWEEEARLLGAKRWAIFFGIRIRMLQKSILIASLIAFLIGWSDYIVTLTVGGGQILSLPLLIGSTASAPGNDSTLATMSLVSIFIPIVMTGTAYFIVKKRETW